MTELARLREGEDVWLLVRYRRGGTRLVSGRVTKPDRNRVVLVTTAGEECVLLEGEIDALFRLPLA